MVKNNINCWEFKKCGLEPGGEKSHLHGVCPAVVGDKYDKINNGHHGGRFCWFVEGTLCDGNKQEGFFEKFEHCVKCEFYLLVEKQENRHLVLVRNDML